MNKRAYGFTIVELLIVIVVIAILAAISIVAYTGIQNQARDAQIRQAVSQIEKSIGLYAVEHNVAVLSYGGHDSNVAPGPNGCSDGAGLGFFGAGTYTCTVEDTLVAAKVLPSGFTAKLPRNPYYGVASNGRLSLMMYNCGTGVKVLFYTLYSPKAEDTASLDNVIATCGGLGVNQRDSWGMRAAKLIRVS